MQPITKKVKGSEGNVFPQQKKTAENEGSATEQEEVASGKSKSHTTDSPQRNELANSCVCVCVCVLSTCIPLLKEKMKMIKAGRCSLMSFFFPSDRKL